MIAGEMNPTSAIPEVVCGEVAALMSLDTTRKEKHVGGASLLLRVALILGKPVRPLVSARDHPPAGLVEIPQRLEVVLDHHLYQLGETDLGLPPEFAARFR